MLNTANNQTALPLANGGRGADGLLGRATEARPDFPFSIPANSLPISSEAEGCRGEDAEVPVWWGAHLVEKVLMPFDFSAASVRLLAAMTSLAQRSRLKISVLHVLSPWVAPIPGGEPHHYDANQDRLETARALLKRVLRSVAAGLTDISAQVVIGTPSDEIVECARAAGPDLIVMPTRSHRKFQNLLRFTTAENVGRRACCPVLSVPESLLIRPPEQGADLLGRCSRIVVPTDFSANSAAALRCAAALARAHGSKVYVVNFPGIPSQRFERHAPGEGNGHERLERWLCTTLQSTEDVRTVVCAGGPSVYLLVRQAELLQANLLVLGTRGYQWAERFRLNSTTDGLLRHASCPVLTLRAGTTLAGC